MTRAALALAVVAGLAGAAHADGATGTITGTVKVTGADGQPDSADGVIVYVVGYTETAPSKAESIQQKNKHFVPDLIAITAGQEVAFPNADTILHNVFSRSSVRPFDLGQYKKGQSKTKSFPKVGVVDVYCNIHPEMAATILIVPNRAHAVVKSDGTFTIEGVQAGTWTVFAYTRLAIQPAKAEVTVTAGAAATVDLALSRGPAKPHDNKFGEPYKKETGQYQ